MKKIVLSFALLIIGLTSIAQSGNLTAIIKNEKSSFVQTENGSVTTFQLKASPEEIKTLKSQAATLSEKLELKVSNDKGGVYNCTLTINHQNHAEYVHKMFLYLGIQSYSVGDVNKTLDSLPETLKSLK